MYDSITKLLRSLWDLACASAVSLACGPAGWRFCCGCCCGCSFSSSFFGPVSLLSSLTAAAARLGVLESWVLVSRRLETRFYKSWSRSWSWNLRVLVWVLILEPSSLGLGLGLGTCDHEDSVFVTHEAWNCPPATSSPVERIFSHSGLLMRANRVRMGDNMPSQLVYLRCNNKL